jgi:S1/P1 Nuclease
MQKRSSLSICVLLFTAVILISWGVTGHRSIGKIAENHLTPLAKAGVRALLGNETLADVSTWPDEVRSQPEYRHTAPWHYLNLPLGLSYADFQTRVQGITQENVYSALLKQEQVLGSSTSSRQEKIEALKYIVHFVGDLHQPMHVSREEDKGGNTIQVNYEGQGTNLHALWDSKLIDHQGLTYEQMAEKYDQGVSAAQVKAWQSDPLIKWIWESYEISSKLYAEIDALNNRTIDDSYYQAHIGIIRERIEEAGVRLAGVLNQIFAGMAANAEAKP